MKENSIEEDIKIIEDFILKTDVDYSEYNEQIVGDISYRAIQHLLSDYKRVLKENEELKKDYYNVINKIENKIDRFDYEFEKAKRKNDKDRADYYWDLIGNFIKLLREE